MKYDIDIFPLGLAPDEQGTVRVCIANTETPWRWFCILHWKLPTDGPDDYTRMACVRAMDPVRLARWAYAFLARQGAGVTK